MFPKSVDYLNMVYCLGFDHRRFGVLVVDYFEEDPGDSSFRVIFLSISLLVREPFILAIIPRV